MENNYNIELKGIDLVNYLMDRFKMDEDEVLNMLSRKLGNVKTSQSLTISTNKINNNKNKTL